VVRTRIVSVDVPASVAQSPKDNREVMFLVIDEILSNIVRLSPGF
jgi:hypothetical protein